MLEATDFETNLKIEMNWEEHVILIRALEQTIEIVKDSIGILILTFLIQISFN